MPENKRNDFKDSVYFATSRIHSHFDLFPLICVSNKKQNKNKNRNENLSQTETRMGKIYKFFVTQFK